MDVQLKGRKLNEDEKAAAVKRLYEDEIKLKTQKHELLIKKVYREDDPKLISTTQLQESIVRQHDAEMKRREMKAKELKNKYYKIADPHRMANEEIEGSLQRVYTDSIRHKEDVHRKLEDKYGLFFVYCHTDNTTKKKQPDIASDDRMLPNYRLKL